MLRAASVAACAVLLLSCLTAMAAGQQIDLGRSMLTIHVGKAGLFSAAGHGHQVVAHFARGTMDAGSSPRIDFVVDARTLTVARDPDLSPDKQAEVQRTMHAKVLESEKYPEITFRSTTIRQTGERKWAVTGELTLHNQSRPIRADVQQVNGSYTGASKIKQTDFGIQPVTVGAGLVKVKNELEIEFVVVPAGAPAVVVPASASAVR